MTHRRAVVSIRAVPGVQSLLSWLRPRTNRLNRQGHPRGYGALDVRGLSQEVSAQDRGRSARPKPSLGGRERARSETVVRTGNPCLSLVEHAPPTATGPDEGSRSADRLPDNEFTALGRRGIAAQTHGRRCDQEVIATTLVRLHP
jgi:hypothetical protein